MGRGHANVSCFRLWFIAVGERGCRSCPNAFQRAHQPWLNTCYGARTKRANPICISDILNIVQSPGITRSFSARWNSKTYFSNLWTDDKSKLSRGQWNIHQRAENRPEMQLQAERARGLQCGVWICFMKHQTCSSQILSQHKIYHACWNTILSWNCNVKKKTLAFIALLK